MDLERFRDYCLSLKGVTEEMPFDNNTLVFKVMGKIFTAVDIDAFESFNVKCDPELAITLRERFPHTVLPGYHMNKKHWNTIVVRGEMGDQDQLKWVKYSYDLVVEKLPKKFRESLKDEQPGQ